MGLIAAALSCAVLLGPCPTAAERPALPVERFAISYERSGGFAPLPRKLTVRPGGQATVAAVHADGRREKVEFRLAPAQIKGLRAKAEAARIGEVEPAVPGSCADCFVYTVAYRGERASVSQVDLSAPMLRLVTRLEALIAAHLPRH
jgi:hypothetical protein